MNNKLNDIFELCMKVNKETEYSIWFEFSGHVNWITVRSKYDLILIEDGYVNKYIEYMKDIVNPLSYSEFKDSLTSDSRNFTVRLDHDSTDKGCEEILEYLNDILSQK